MQVQQELTLPLSAEAQIIQTSEYRRAAASIGIQRHPRSNRAAPWVGRALGADFVLLVDGAKQWDGQHVTYFLGIRLIRSANGQLLHEQRYFLPDGALTPTMGVAILQELLAAMAAGAGLKPAPLTTTPAQAQPAAKNAPAAARPAEAPAQPKHAPAVQHEMTPPAAPRAAGPSTAAGPAKKTASATHTWGSLGLRSAWRRAQLRDASGAGPINYGSGLGLGRPLFGGSVIGGLSHGRVGAEGQFVVMTGKQSAQTGGANDAGQVMVTQLRGAVAVQLLALTSARLAPRAGVLYERLPVDLGPFMGLSFLAATAGMEVGTPPLRHVQVLAGLDGVFVGVMGLEAKRAGKPHLAQGLNAALTPRLMFGHFDVEINLGAEYRVARFSGATALFSHRRGTDMHLSDIRLSLALQLGGRW